MIHNKKDLTRSVCNWILATQDYFFDIEYVPGKSIPHADALSRMYPAKQSNQNSDIHACFIETDIEQGWEPCIDYTGWGDEQKKDPILRKKYKVAMKGRDQNFAIKHAVLFQLVEGNTPYEKRYLPLVPRSLQGKLIRQFHGPPAAGHLGPERTYLQMKQFVYWTGMQKDVTAFVEKCDLCQRNKRSYLRVPMQKQRIPEGVFDTVSMDIVGPVVPSSRGEKYILVVQDQLSKWVELIPLRSTETEKILEKFMDRWVFRYGPPEKLLTDRASNFLSATSQEFCRFFGIEKINTTAYRPQGNASNERMHAEMVKYLSIFLDGTNHSKWNLMLGEAAFAYNTSYNSILKMSPFEVLFGQLPAIGPLGIPRNTEEAADFEKFYEQRREQLTYKRQLAQNAINRWQEMILKQRNKFAHEMKFAVGDTVLYKNHLPKTKFDNKFKGPWKITRVMSPVLYELELDGRKFVAHAKYMKPYKENEQDSTTAHNGTDFNNIEILSDDEQTKEDSLPNDIYIEDVTKGPEPPGLEDSTFEPINHSTPTAPRSAAPLGASFLNPSPADTPQRTPLIRSLMRSVFTPRSRKSLSFRQEKRKRQPPKYMAENYVLK
jgi:transposase InsO family protein